MTTEAIDELSTQRATMRTARSESDALTGLLYGIAAYSFWGIVAAYFKQLAHVPPLVVLSNRIAWSTVVLVIIVASQRRWRDVLAGLRNRRTMLLLIASTIAIAINWFTFIWAVTNGQLLQSSLGYFLAPLVTVLLGVIVLRERLRRGQIVALILTTVAVSTMIFSDRQLPIVALTLGLSFSLYGLIRKQTVIAPTTGLLIETLMLLPFMLLVISSHTIAHDESLRTHALLALSGVITAVPLLWFVAAARRLRLSTLGFLQYLSPTGQFILGRFVYDEPFSATKLVCFSIVWVSLIIFTIDSAVSYRRQRALAVQPPPAA